MNETTGAESPPMDPTGQVAIPPTTSSRWWSGSVALPVVRPTLGGPQWWADVFLRNDWRIQAHVHTGVHRLLSPWAIQRAEGTFSHCVAELQRLAPASDASSTSTPTVIVLHGLIRTVRSMRTIAQHLRQHGMNAYPIEYPSTQAPIARHADTLARVVRSIPGESEIHLVGHSMGGLVIRAYLDGDADPRVRRVVMIGTPNQGAEKATFFKRLGLIQLIGPGALELVPEEGGICHELSPCPTGVEVGIIAGGGPYGRGLSFMLPADNDGVVTVKSTLLKGAADFCLVRGHHAFLPSLLSVRTATERFLRTGCFRTNGHRCPVYRVDVVPDKEQATLRTKVA